MDDALRLHLERFIDRMIDDAFSARTWEFGSKDRLQELGIAPSVETVLSHISGIILGITIQYSTVKYGNLRDEDLVGTTKMLIRRVREIREAFYLSRLED